MALKLFNTLARSVQEFVPLDPAGKRVGMYCCGPTVYDLAHIGNFRTFVFADLVRRFLEFKGYAVRHVMNITDVEDKIIRRVRETGQPLATFTGHYEQAFREDLKTLHCLDPHDTPRATAYVAEMITLIEQLIARGVAYRAPDGSVYFSIEKYRGGGCTYGQLVKLNFDPAEAGRAVSRVSSDEYEKESLADFALWKARAPDDGAVFWPSPWGEGRPGWHIECSAMSMKLLGTSFDIHMGGEDLMFPHHEDEIAQSEGALAYPPGQHFVKYWLHGAHLLVEGRKMSKSLGNYFTLRDLLAKGFTGREIRYLLLTAHYREQFNFTLEGLHGARSALARIDECLGKLREIAPLGVPPSGGPVMPPPEGGTPNLIAGFAAALDDDLNISAAWGGVFDWVRETNRMLAANAISNEAAASVLANWSKIDAVLGVGKPPGIAGSGHLVMSAETMSGTGYVTPPEVMDLLAARQAARQAKDFNRSDAIRDELKAKGWVIEDTPKGPRLKQL